ncbi:MAG: hypothetical protein F4237_13110, partial [Gemmatimonadetes bacterium]|nr:hypothetical protein [Gemmatimonadota bacterium]
MPSRSCCATPGKAGDPGAEGARSRSRSVDGRPLSGRSRRGRLGPGADGGGVGGAGEPAAPLPHPPRRRHERQGLRRVDLGVRPFYGLGEHRYLHLTPPLF